MGYKSLWGKVIGDAIIPVSKSYDWTEAETASIVWTPETGKRFVVTSIIIACNTAGNITLFEDTDTLANRIVKGYFGDKGGLVTNFGINPRPADNINKAIKITTSAGAGSVLINGFEE